MKNKKWKKLFAYAEGRAKKLKIKEYDAVKVVDDYRKRV